MLNNKSLKNWLIAVGVLVLLIVVVDLLQSKRNKSSFRTKIVEIDTAKVSDIEFYKNGKVADAINLVKKGKNWRVKQRDGDYPAEKNAIKNMISQILRIKPERLAAKSKDKWANYNVVDSSAIHLFVKEGSKTTLDLLVGRFSAEKSNNPYSQRPDMYTYVRVNGESETYLVAGFLSIAFDVEISHYRDKKITKFKSSDVKKLIFSYPDSSFTVENQNNKWIVSGSPADSAKTVKYILAIDDLFSSYFAKKERVDKASKEAKYKLRIEGNNMKPIEIKAFPVDSMLLIHSSINLESHFLGDKMNLQKKIFVGKESFK